MLLQMTRFLTFLWLSNITSYVCIFVYIDKSLSIHVYHVFFSRSSFDGHLGCFHMLPVVDSAAVTVGVQVFL